MDQFHGRHFWILLRPGNLPFFARLRGIRSFRVAGNRDIDQLEGDLLLLLLKSRRRLALSLCFCGWVTFFLIPYLMFFSFSKLPKIPKKILTFSKGTLFGVMDAHRTSLQFDWPFWSPITVCHIFIDKQIALPWKRLQDMLFSIQYFKGPRNWNPSKPGQVLVKSLNFL